MNNNDEEKNVENEEKYHSKKNKGSKLSSAVSKLKGAKDLVNDIRDSGGLTGLAKNVAKDKINNKLNQKKDDIKNNIKEKANNALPDSVKQKRDAAKAKLDGIKNKVNQPKEKFEKKKQEINEKAFKKGLRTAADSIAPGSGVAAENLLKTPEGQEAIQEARNSSNPASAIKNGTKKIIEIVIKKETIKKTVISILPSLICSLVVIITVLSIIGKFVDGLTYFRGNPNDGQGSGDVSKLDKKYQAFYKNVEKYGTSNKAMVIAVLTGYKDNDIYSDVDDNQSTVDSCTDEEINSGECFKELDSSGVEIYSKSKMKKYIKKVNKAIDDSGGDVTEGDYKDPSNTGSNFFKWLYTDFIGDYYSEYISSDTQEASKKKTEIIRFIYLYYNELNTNSSTDFSCVDGEEIRTTIYGGNNLGAGISKYDKKLSTNERGWFFYEKDGKKYLVLAAATNICINIGCGYTDKHMTARNYTRYDYIKYYDYWDTLVVNVDGKNYDAIILDSCGACQWSKEVRGDKTNNRLDIFVDNESTSSAPDYSYISSGCGFSGDLVRLGNSDIYSESVVPIGNLEKDLYVSSGYYRSNGNYHGAIDISCHAGGLNCQKYKIIASHSGVVSSLNRENCNSYSAEAAHKTGIPYYEGCDGTHVTIRVDSGPYSGYTFLYWHLSYLDPSIKVGSKIQAGQYLGQLGNTGNSSGPHLHFAIRNSSGKAYNMNSIFYSLLS